MADYRDRYAQAKTVPMTEEEHLALRKRLMHPDHPVDVVLDTDTYNEIDDQYALSYLLKSGDKLTVKALCAAPFFNNNSTSFSVCSYVHGFKCKTSGFARFSANCSKCTNSKTYKRSITSPNHSPSISTI